MNPSQANRFQKGKSGNPLGRPRKPKPPGASAFDILFDRTLIVTQGGLTRVLPVEEALQYKLYEQALAGKRQAIRAVLKMIMVREKARAAKAPSAVPIRMVRELDDPDNAYDALLILEIVVPDPGWSEHAREPRLLLRPWAVEAAMRRKGGTMLNQRDIASIKRLTRDAQTLTWPRSIVP